MDENTLKNLNMGMQLVQTKLAESNQKLLLLAVSGSHSWGLQRPDSDFDLRGVYQESTLNVLDINKPRDTVEFTDGLYDVQLYEVEKFFKMLCGHNGNMVMLLHLPDFLYEDDFIFWRNLGHSFLTKKLRFYYRGYADSQRKRALSQKGGKALIYTYREMFTGLYLMKHGTVCFDFNKLWREAEHDGWYVDGLLYKYYPNHRQYFPAGTQNITPDEWNKFYIEWEKLSELLDKEAEKSSLPDAYDGYDICNTLLRGLRIQNIREEINGKV